VYADLAYDSPELHSLIAMVHEYYCEDVAAWARTNVDAISMMDDWGSNRSLLINPGTWRAVFQPLYRDYCDIIRKAGKLIFFHSDGNIEAIFGDFVALGVHAINSQLFCMDIEGLARKYRGKITFWGEIDRQQVLPYGTQDDVRTAVMRVRRALHDPAGGVIAQCEWGKDNKAENIEAVFAAWEEPMRISS
jgi:uroporphyrinogen-III decarboxylase